MNNRSIKLRGLTSLPLSFPKSHVAEIVLSGLCLELFALGVPIFAQVIFDKVVINGSLGTLHVIAIGMLIATAFETLLAFIYARHIHYFSAEVDHTLTRPVMGKLLDMPLSHLDSRPKGEVAAHVREIAQVREFLSAVSITSVIDIVFMVFVVAIMWIYSPMLTGVVLLSIPVLALLSVILKPKIKSDYARLRNRADAFEALLSEGLHNMPTIKALALESIWKKRWSESHTSFVSAALNAKYTAALEDSALRMSQRLIVLVVLWVGALEVLSATLTMGQLVACYMFSLRIIGPSTRVFQVGLALVRLQEARKNLTALMGAPSEQDDRAQGAFSAGDICFRGVHFKYAGGGADVLNDFNLSVRRGEFVGIIGSSGSGKSTVARLLQGHIHPYRGHITVADNLLDITALQDLRKAICLVTHDSALFHGTVRNNIASWDPDVNEEWLAECCRLVEAAEFLSQLPEGLDTVLDEKGSQLSSGQRQRVALARAIYRKPQILVMDEATNALDLPTESTILLRIRSLFEGHTVLVITHRDHMLEEFDSVISIKDGKAAPVSPQEEVG